MPKVKLLSDFIGKFYHKDFMSKKFHQISYGGRASLKSSRNATKIINSMKNNPNEEWIVCRQNHAHHKETTFRELIKVCERLGMKEGIDFTRTKGNKPILKIIHRKEKTVSEIQFIGIADFTKIKGYNPSGNDKYFGGIWFFEIDEFDSSYNMDQVISTYSRGNNEDFICLYEFNPPERGHWVYEWLKTKEESDSSLVKFSTIYDLTEYEKNNWLGKNFLAEVESIKKTNYDIYKNIYLGEFRELTGACYPNPIKTISPDYIKENNIKFRFINVGLDFGEVDGTTAVAVGVTFKEEYYVIKQYYYKGNKDKTVNIKVNEIGEFLNNLSDEYRCSINAYCDTNPMTSYVLLKDQQTVKLRGNIRIKMAQKKAFFGKSLNAIQERIDAINFLISSERIFINEDLKILIQAMLMASYDSNGNRLDNGSSDIDSLDAFEYAIRPEINYILRNHFSNIKSDNEK